MMRLTALCLWALFLVIVLSSPAFTAEPLKPLLVVDVSGSMNGPKLKAAIEGAKLSTAMLRDDCNVRFVAFNDRSLASPLYPLDSIDSRKLALTWLDQLKAEGGTNYLDALQSAFDAKPDVLIFLSDGLASNPPDQVLQCIQRQPRIAVHTIAIDCGSNSTAEKLLSEMATLSRGSFSRVEHSEDLVKSLVGIVARVGNYYRYSPGQPDVKLGLTAPGTLIAFGYDAQPEIVATKKSAQWTHRADLPGEKVHVEFARLEEAEEVYLRLSNQTTKLSRLGDIHLVGGGLPEPHLSVHCNSLGMVAANSKIPVAVGFTDRSGRVVDPADATNLGAEFDLVGQDGKVLDHSSNTRHEGKQIIGELKAPASVGPVTVRGRMTVETPDGAKFVAEQHQTVQVVEPLRLKASPSPLEVKTKVGAFETSISVATETKAASVEGLTADLQREIDGLRLVECRQNTTTLSLHFEAKKSGKYRGNVVITGTSESLIAPLSVPFLFEVEERSKGLDLVKDFRIAMGRVGAGSGEVRSTIEIKSLDDEEFEYDVVFEDLANASGLLELSASKLVIQPTSKTPAMLTVTTSVGAIAAGEFMGKLAHRETVGVSGISRRG